MSRITINYPEKTLFSCDIPVRITDINYGQHLAHDKLISMLHEARAQLFQHFNMSESDIEGLGIIMSDLAIKYQAEAFYPDSLTIEISLAEPTRCGFNMYYRITKNDTKVIATAKTGLVFFNYQYKKPALIPTSFNALLKDPA